MKTASTALINFLANNSQFFMADLYTITLVGGFVVRYTNYDSNLVVNGNAFAPFGIQRSNTRVTVGLEVDSLTIDVFPASIDLLNGVAWLSAARTGALDSATVKVERLYMPTPGDTSLGTITLFQGRVSDVQAGRSTAQLTVKSELELFDTQLPRNMFQSGCINTLYDHACGLNKSSYAWNAIVQAGATTTTIPISPAPYDGYFALGSIQFTSGVNNSIRRSVRGFSGGVLVLALPLVSAPAAGDSLTGYPGCDKLQGTCSGKFNNVINFRGFPFIPDPETAT